MQDEQDTTKTNDIDRGADQSPAESADAGQAPAGAGTPATDDSPTDAPARVRRRRATKATAAPTAAQEGAAAAAAQPEGDGAAGAQPGGEAGPLPAGPVLEGGVSGAGETPGYSQDGAQPTAGEDDVPPPAKRVRKKAAPRKRTARSAADEALADVLATPAEPVVEAREDDPAFAQSASEDVVPEASIDAGGVAAPDDDASDLAAPDPEAADAARDVEAADGAAPGAGGEAADTVTPGAEEPPVARTRRRRAPAVVTFQAPVVDQPADEAPEATDAPEPRRRRRAGTTGALPASALIPTLLEPEPVPDEPEPEPSAVEEAEDSDEDGDRPRRRRRGRRGRGPRREDGEEATGESEEAVEDRAPADETAADEDDDTELAPDGTRRRRRRRRRSGGGGLAAEEGADDVPTVVHVREPRTRATRGATAADEDGVRGITGSTRMAAKRARRQEGRDSGRRRPAILSEAEFLARREAVDRTMIVRQQGDRTQMAVLEDGVLVEHYVTKASAQSYAGNVYLGKVQNVLPSMEAAFIDIGKGKNGVLYAGEVNYDAQLAGHGPRKIEQVLKSGQDVLVQVSKDPIGHKGARLTSQVSLPGRYLVYVPEGSMTGISRKLPEEERNRLKAILKKVVPDDAGVIIRTAAEGASEEELSADVRRLQTQWEVIRSKAAAGGGPVQLHAEPDLVIRVVRDVFNEDFTSLVVQGDGEWDTIKDYVEFVAPDLGPRLSRHESAVDVFAAHRVDEQLAKALDRKVWLPSGGSLVIDRTEAMVVIDVNTGKYVGKGGNLEETVTRNNLEAAEEIARQLRLRDLGGIIVVDFIDMVLESNRDLVVRRLVECLGRDRTKHQVAEVTSLGLVQMTRKRVGQGLLESFSETCAACDGRGVLVHSTPVESRPDREPRDRAKVSAAVALVAAASRQAPKVPDVVVDDSTETQTETESETGAESGSRTGRGRRRRGGRGAGTPGVSGAPDDAVDPELVDDAPLAPDVEDLADIAPDLVPELADQPSSAQEDVPVLPDLAPFGGDDPEEPQDSDAPEPVAPDQAEDDELDATAVAPEPVDVEAEPGPEPAPENVVPEPEPEPEPAPRRRRRATSRPAGSPGS